MGDRGTKIANADPDEVSGGQKKRLGKPKGFSSSADGKVMPITQNGISSYHGRVLEIVIEHGYQLMSDVWAPAKFAHVWDDDTQSVKVIILQIYDSAYPDPLASAEVDATPEIVSLRDTKRSENLRKKAELERLYQIDLAAAYHHTPEKGKSMRVVRGRKKVGTEGVVFWLGHDSFGNPKAGLALDDSRDSFGRYANVVWVRADYLENCEPFDYKKAA
jgi:hypothetical protein